MGVNGGEDIRAPQRVMLKVTQHLWDLLLCEPPNNPRFRVAQKDSESKFYSF